MDLPHHDGARHALVIGNATYPAAPLRNPVNDARDMARALRETGFRVTLLEDATQRAMKQAIQEFGQRLPNGSVGLFYFAGHGIQGRNRNWLLPVDAELVREADLELWGVDAEAVLAQLEGAGDGLTLMILDACRNNPLARAFRSAARGLAAIHAHPGSLIAYATAPGELAADGDGVNGVYTQELLKNIRAPGIPVEDVFKRTRVGVQALTGGRQVPWESSSLTGYFFFVPLSVAPAVDPDPFASPDREFAQAFARGAHAYNAGDMQGAERAFLDALGTGHPDPGAYYNLGVIYGSQGRLDEATRSYEQALRVAQSPEAARLGVAHRDAWTNTLIGLLSIGTQYFEAGDFLSALHLFRRITVAEPLHRDAAYNEALTLRQLGRWHELAPVARRLVGLDPLNHQARMFVYEAESQIAVAAGAQGNRAAEAVYRGRAQATLATAAQLPVFLDRVQFSFQGGVTRISGQLGGGTRPAGRPVPLELTLYGPWSTRMGGATVTLAAPAPGTATPFLAQAATPALPTSLTYRLLS